MSTPLTHSILLGSKDRNEVRELFKARDFETLTTDYVVSASKFLEVKSSLTSDLLFEPNKIE